MVADTPDSPGGFNGPMGGPPNGPPPRLLHASPTGEPLPPDHRRAILAAVVTDEVAHHLARVETMMEYQGVLLYGGQVNHVMHALMALVTCGVWLIVWLLLVVFSEPRRRVIWVDDVGNVWLH
jgi:hypothetical protein